MSRTRTLVLIGVLAASSPLVWACEEEGPAERAGRQLDEAVEDTQGAFEELGREVGEAADESKEAADELRDAVQNDEG